MTSEHQEPVRKGNADPFFSGRSLTSLCCKVGVFTPKTAQVVPNRNIHRWGCLFDVNESAPVSAAQSLVLVSAMGFMSCRRPRSAMDNYLE